MISLTKLMLEVLSETSFKTLVGISEPGRVDRSGHVNTKSLPVSTIDDKETWTFSYKSQGIHSTTGKRWHGHIKFEKKNVLIKDNAEDLDCAVSCDCPDYKFRYSYNNHKEGAGDLGANNGQPPRSRAQGGVGDYGVGLCVAKGELISTDRGFLPIELVSTNDKVWTLDGWQQVINSGLTGIKKVIEIKLKSGRVIKVTPEHRIFVFSEQNGFEWVAAKMLNNTHFLCITLPENINTISEVIDIPEYNNGRKLYYPATSITLNTVIAELMGYMISEGSKDGIFSNLNDKINNDFYQKWTSIFGENSCIVRKYGCNVGHHGGKILERLGFICGSYNKKVPDWIMHGNRDIIIAFLRGCYAGDGNFRNHHSTYASVSESLARNMQLLLSSVGIRTKLKCYKSGVNKSDTWTIRTSSQVETTKLYNLLNPIRGYSSSCNINNTTTYPSDDYLIKNAYRFFEKIIIDSFILPTDTTLISVKNAVKQIEWLNPTYRSRLSGILKKKKLLKSEKNQTTGIYTNMARIVDIYKILEKYRAEKILNKLSISKANKWKFHRNELVEIIKKLQNVSGEAYQKVKLLEREDITFDAFESRNNIESDVEVYDLTIDKSENFTVNGVVVHNCKHLIALGKYLQTSIDAPDPKDGLPEPKVAPAKVLPAKVASIPSIPQTTQAPDPDDDIDTYSDSRTGLEEGKISKLYNRFRQFVNTHKEFNVPYE